jgi:uncharacterized membrane protein YqjE
MWEREQNGTGTTGGISGSIRRILESATGFLTTKVELLSIELQEEKRRVLEILILASFAILFAILALIVVSFTIVVIFWEHRFEVLIGMSALYLIVSIFLFLRLQAKAKIGAKIFQTTVDELKKDSEWLNRHL